jgi:serine/threonine protein phosphatase PrpC
VRDDTDPSTASPSPSGRSAIGTGVQRFRASSALVRVDVGALSHPGLLRENNEDQFLVTKMLRALETIITSLPPGDVPERAEEINYVMVVADGMGGHAAGELASRLAISAIVNLTLELPDWIFKLDTVDSDEVELRLRGRAQDIVQQAGSVVFRKGRDEPGLSGMGTTLTAARSLGRDLLVVHVGDSRAYLYRAGGLNRLTKDHTFAQLLVDRGKLQACDIAASGVRHILTNALGGSSEHVDVDVDLLGLEDGDRLVLCTDGLTDLVEDETIAQTLAAVPTPSDACAELVRLALDRGGRDNVTVVVANYSFASDPA